MQMQLILLANIILSIGAIAGISVFASQTGDVYILTDTYGFYWFVSTFSLLAGIIGYAYHKVNYVKEQFPKSEYGIYGMAVITLLFTVFWLAASASMTSVLRNCLQIKNLLYPEYIRDNKATSLLRYYNYTCNGQIITTTFGYSLFILWCVVSYIVAIKMFSKLKTTQNPESLETKQAEEYWPSSANEQTHQAQEQQQQTYQAQEQTHQAQEQQQQTYQAQEQTYQTQEQTYQTQEQTPTEQTPTYQTECQQIELNQVNIVQVE